MLRLMLACSCLLAVAPAFAPAQPAKGGKAVLIVRLPADAELTIGSHVGLAVPAPGRAKRQPVHRGFSAESAAHLRHRRRAQPLAPSGRGALLAVELGEDRGGRAVNEGRVLPRRHDAGEHEHRSEHGLLRRPESEQHAPVLQA